MNQDPSGRIIEMHPEAHRGKGNDKINHPNKGQPSKQNRKAFNKQRKTILEEGIS